MVRVVRLPTASCEARRRGGILRPSCSRRDCREHSLEHELVWCETRGPSRWTSRMCRRLLRQRTRAAWLALDNTWSAGVLFNAFDHGVDISVQALTKYVGGHSDLLLGSVSVRDENLYQRLGVAHQDLGMSCSPDDCSLALRGLQTLSVRLKAVEASALRVASWLADRAEVETVLHPALPSCPGMRHGSATSVDRPASFPSCCESRCLGARFIRPWIAWLSSGWVTAGAASRVLP